MKDEMNVAAQWMKLAHIKVVARIDTGASPVLRSAGLFHR